MAIRRASWSQEWQQSALCPMLFALPTRQLRFEPQMCGGNICSWIEGHALNLDTTSMNSKHTGYSPSQVIWAIWGVSSPRQDVKLPLCGGKVSPQLPVTGKPPPWADNPIPVFKSQGLAHWGLDWSGVTPPTLFQPGSSGKGWCWLQITGASGQPSCAAPSTTLEQALEQSSAGLFAAGNSCWERQTGPWIQPCADPTPANPSVRLFFEG